MYGKKLAGLLAVLFVIAASMVYAGTNPTGASNMKVNWTQRNIPYEAKTVEAMAGNITELEIRSLTQTRSWQGYVGNISGTIVLDDASNYTLYDWQNAEPRGQIYATNKSTVNWETINCFEYYADGGSRYNLTKLESDLGMNVNDVDTVNKTFNESDNPSIFVGSKQIPASKCPTTNMFQSDLQQNINFYEMLLTDNTSDSVIYTAIIENRTPGGTNDLPGYNGVTYDFQMLVGENGHGTDIATTTYWFFVELV